MRKLLSRFNKPIQDLIVTTCSLVVIYIVITILSSLGIISSTMQGLLPQLCYYSVAAVSLNLCVGYIGDLSLGHAGFMSVGAFVSAVCTSALADVIPSLGVRFVISLIVGVLCAGLAGFLIGIPVLRLHGDYLAIVTLAFGEIIKGILQAMYVGITDDGIKVAFLNQPDWYVDADKMIIDGAKGIIGTPRASNFTNGMIILILSLVVCTLLVNSRTGRAIQAIRDNRIAAESVGIKVPKYKIIGFTISAAIAGAAGVLYSHYNNMVTALKFDFNLSILILVFVVMGGLGNYRGSIIAAILLTLLPELLRGLSTYRMLIYSILLIVMMLFNWAPSFIEKKERFKAFLSSKISRKKEAAK